MNELARRFYEAAGVAESDDGFGVTLDARTLRTPGNRVFRAPTRALAEAVAAEWAAQGEHIVPANMPLTQLAFAATDATAERREELSRALTKYLETDLLCHRAEAPPALVARQSAAWDPIMAWAESRFGLRMPVVTGVIPAGIPPQHIAAFEQEIDALDDMRRTALAQAVTLAGSALIGFALVERRLDADQAYAAAMLDEEWSLETWGEDAEARAKLKRKRAEFATLERFIATLGAP
jgi:chaperone required for assembly of F1-ATPase